MNEKQIFRLYVQKLREDIYTGKRDLLSLTNIEIKITEDEPGYCYPYVYLRPVHSTNEEI